MPNTTRNAALAAALSGAALMTPGIASADGEGLMLGGSVLYAQLDEDFDRDDIDWDDPDFDDLGAIFDDKSVGFNGQIGWRFNKWIALDAGYWDLGSFSSDRIGDTGEKIDLDVTALSLGGMVSVPLWILDLYGRAGWTWWDAESRLTRLTGLGNEGLRFAYDALGREVERHMPGGLVHQRSYLPTGELSGSSVRRGGKLLHTRRDATHEFYTFWRNLALKLIYN